jgi:hypothetical protein
VVGPPRSEAPLILDRLLFGDNQFFGVNHMSEERARIQAMRFQDVSAITEVIGYAYDEGITSFMCTTHDRIADVSAIVRENRSRYPSLQFLPSMPYAHKYADAVTELGMIGALRMALPQEGILNAVARGGKSLASKDIASLTTLLVDAEMKMFADLPTPVIFLQNVVVDLLLGLGMTEPLRVFSDHVRDRYGARAGFITMNLPLALTALEKAGVDQPVLCFNLNKIGFRMSGGFDAYRAALENGGFHAVAMSVFASGAIPPREALEWVRAQPGVDSVVFGASTLKNIRGTRELVDELWS